jgi:hypothetical protein
VDIFQLYEVLMEAGTGTYPPHRDVCLEKERKNRLFSGRIFIGKNNPCGGLER